MTERIVTDANGRKHITSEPLLHPPRGRLTKEQATAIMDMARKLEDTGRLSVLVRNQDNNEWRDKNREVHCALQDYLKSLSEE